MAKCDICKQRIDTTFLGKLRGTFVKDEKGRPHTVCFSCQSRFHDKNLRSEIKQ